MRNIDQEFELTRANDLSFWVDTKGSPLAEGESRVYPYHDEARDLKAIAATLNSRFDMVVDAFAGGGHSMLPILHSRIAQEGLGVDINPRAVELAQANAKLNNLHGRARFVRQDIVEGLPRFAGKVLYIANPPFALPAQGVDMDRMRDGGFDGLHLTRAYIDLALMDTYISEAIHGSKRGDAIIGLAYSRISIMGEVELLAELASRVSGFSSFKLELVEGATLWRGANGKKEQDNPMSLDRMHLKAVPGLDYDRQVVEYNDATQRHLAAGYNRLGYFRYVVEVG